MKTIDARGVDCPKPVIMVKKEIEDGTNTDITTIVDNEMAKENVSKFLSNMNIPYSIIREGTDYYIKCKKDSKKKEKLETISSESEENMVVMIDKDKMGAGNDELGEVLAKGFIYSMIELEVPPKTIIFVNSGIKFSTAGSPSIDDLKILESKGTEIYTCGTCLDYYDAKDKLAIGEITNMYTIVEKLSKATNILKI